MNSIVEWRSQRIVGELENRVVLIETIQLKEQRKLFYTNEYGNNYV